jgi:hypothetical protein
LPFAGSKAGLLCVASLVVAVAPAVADGAGARTPAEIEQRRTEVSERLVAIELEAAAIKAALARLAVRSTETATAGDVEQRRLETRRGALAEEQLTLQRELLDLARQPTRNATGPLRLGDPQGLSPLDLGGQSGQVSSGQAFNPAISVIPDVAYYYDRQRGQAGNIVASADGFAAQGHSHADAHEHGHATVEQGFNLREMELAFSGAVDPYFDVWATLAVSPDAVEAEEVYVQTRRLLPGLQLRAGKFFSGVGYVNKQHPHQWDFVDQALPFAALLGGNLAETGLQLTWLPGLPVYTLVGVEALQGDGERLSNQESEHYPAVFAAASGPRLFTGFLKVAPDLGFSHVLQGGVSVGRSRHHQEAIEFEDDVLDQGLSGIAWFAGTDWVWRYDSARPFGQGDVSVQAEYLYRRKDLALVARDGVVVTTDIHHRSAQDGFYGQAVYGIAPRWTLAGRLDVIGLTNQLETPDEAVDFGRSTRYSAALTFNPTEFSRLRLQYNAGRVRSAGTASVSQLFVQLQVSLGAHGAHRF